MHNPVVLALIRICTHMSAKIYIQTEKALAGHLPDEHTVSSSVCDKSTRQLPLMISPELKTVSASSCVISSLISLDDITLLRDKVRSSSLSLYCDRCHPSFVRAKRLSSDFEPKIVRCVERAPKLPADMVWLSVRPHYGNLRLISVPDRHF